MANSSGYNQTSTSTADIQRNLGITSDNIYGAQTTAAVKAFQQANGLTADGIFGAKTLAAYNSKYGSGAISPNQLQTATPLQIVPPPVDGNNYPGMINGALDYVGNFAKDTAAQLAGEKTAAESGNAYISGLQSLLGKSADTAAANESSGLNAATNQLRDLNAQAQSLSREAQAIPLITQENNRNTGATDRGVAPQDAGARRLNAIKSIEIAQRADVASANYVAARDKAQEIVDLKYKPLEDNLKVLEAQYNINKDALTRLDSKKAESLKLYLDKQAEDLQDSKNIALEAAKNFAPQSILDDIAKAKTFDEKVKAAGSYLATSQNDIIKLDNGNTVLVDKRTGKVIKNFGGAAPTGGNGQYSVTQGMVTGGGGDIVSQISQVIKGSGAKQNEQTNNALNVISGLQSLVDSNPSGEFPGLAPIRLLPGKFKTPEQIANLASIQAINLKVQQWASGAALTEAQTKQVAKLTPQKGDTDKQVKAKVNELTNYMLSQIRGQLAGQGIDFIPQKIDLFSAKSNSPEEKLKSFYENPQYKAQIEQAVSLYPTYSADDILQVLGLTQ